MAYLTDDEVTALGLRAVGARASISRWACFFGVEHIEIGSDVRIDSFALVTAGPGVVWVGDNGHRGAPVRGFGTAGVRIGHFVSLSSGVAIYSTSDDFNSGHLSGPTVPADVRRVDAREVVFDDHVLVGANAVVLPGTTIGRGGSVGALSLVKAPVASGDVVGGVPARVIGRRDLERLEQLEGHMRRA
jgi:dTDP-4-amino-4,6-dideoxy-D-glucose acyltransferase